MLASELELPREIWEGRGGAVTRELEEESCVTDEEEEGLDRKARRSLLELAAMFE